MQTGRSELSAHKASLFSARDPARKTGRSPMTTGRTGRKGHAIHGPATSSMQMTPAAAITGSMDALDTCMELEHVLGYTGHFPRTLKFKTVITKDDCNTMIYPIGAVMVLQDLRDPHKQCFLQGHDAEICCMDVSRCGKFLATGQLGSKKHAASAAPVLVWSLETLTHIYVFEGLFKNVGRVSFSPDAHFVAATSGNTVIIWDIDVGELVLSKRLTAPITVMEWGVVSLKGRRPAYQLAIATNSQVQVLDIFYDVRSVRYVIEANSCLLPTSGLIRHFLAATVTENGQHLLIGCSNGELCVFDIKNKLFKCSMSTPCHSGVRSLEIYKDILLVGGGGGQVCKMQGGGEQWKLVKTTRLHGGVVSLSIRSDNGSEILVGTNAGMMYLVHMVDMTRHEISNSHVDRINAVAFMTGMESLPARRAAEKAGTVTIPPSDIFATASDDGCVYVWDLSDYAVKTRIEDASSPLCIRFCMYGGASSAQRPTIISGWKDASIRAYDAMTAKIVFQIKKAHGAPISSLNLCEHYMVTGCVQGKVRCWNWAQDMMIQFHEHRQPVTAVVPDNMNDQICHSCSTDGTIMSYDVRKGRRVATHNMARRGKFTDMTQRLDSETEVITVTTSGQVHCWDIDEDNPVLEYGDNRENLNCVSLSRSGTLLAIGGDSSFVKVYHMPSTASGDLELVAIGQGHFSAVTDLQWSPDEKQLVSVSDNCSMCVWNFYGVV